MANQIELSFATDPKAMFRRGMVPDLCAVITANPFDIPPRERRLIASRLDSRPGGRFHVEGIKARGPTLDDLLAAVRCAGKKRPKKAKKLK